MRAVRAASFEREAMSRFRAREGTMRGWSVSDIDWMTKVVRGGGREYLSIHSD